MTTTTDTGPDVQVTNATTGEVYPTQVLDEVTRLDGAASDGMFLPKVPVQTERKPHLPRREHQDVPARDDVRIILAALADTPALARHTADDATEG